MESIKEVRSILASVKREEEKHARVRDSRARGCCHALLPAVPDACAKCLLRCAIGHRQLLSHTLEKQRSLHTATLNQLAAPPAPPTPPSKGGKATDYGAPRHGLSSPSLRTAGLTAGHAKTGVVRGAAGKLSSASGLELTTLTTLSGDKSSSIKPLATGDGHAATPISALLTPKPMAVEDVLDLESLVESTELIFKLLQLACEDFWNYMREQDDSLHPVNLVRGRRAPSADSWHVVNRARSVGARVPPRGTGRRVAAVPAQHLPVH